MKRILALWLAAMLIAVQPLSAAVCVGFGSSAPSGWLETFEGTGYAQSGWTETLTPNEDYATGNAPLVGSQSLAVANKQAATWTGAAAITSVDFIISFEATENVNDSTFIGLIDSGGTTICYAYLRAANTLRLGHGTRIPAVGPTIAADTTYHIWIDYAPGTGENGTAALYLTAYTGSETKPGVADISITNGTATADAVGFKFLQDENTTENTVIDNVAKN